MYFTKSIAFTIKAQRPNPQSKIDKIMAICVLKDPKSKSAWQNIDRKSTIRMPIGARRMKFVGASSEGKST